MDDLWGIVHEVFEEGMGRPLSVAENDKFLAWMTQYPIRSVLVGFVQAIGRKKFAFNVIEKFIAEHAEKHSHQADRVYVEAADLSDMELRKKAQRVLERALQSDDDRIRLKASEVILQYIH
ncbi:hypothetical protein Heshes_24270 [Alicyclobacillus hesperidum]|uniref:Uncharacterized protein n=1 Tax=Alicyclobacillus hesperidum TaxID=89784 RepID=A0A1H2X5R3_9BACL|nr:hypothetical protein [Alicyclobacillus hesperidum]GLV14743.1 hypothetical protein Heshes_24270 [Alicyclobacillus hesperidum]SDW88118.1 hypothetical protein SAMN04489725_11852 [Alicyclobacillus hesperidum]